MSKCNNFQKNNYDGVVVFYSSFSSKHKLLVLIDTVRVAIIHVLKLQLEEENSSYLITRTFSSVLINCSQKDNIIEGFYLNYNQFSIKSYVVDLF